MAHITTQEVAAIREELKARFGKKFKFSVTRRDRGLAVVVAIMASDVDFSDLWADKVPGDYGYGYKDINTYHVTTENYGDHAHLFAEIVEIIKTAPAKAHGGCAWFDKSDAMTDYFHTAYYFDLHVGRWDREYVKKAA